MPNLNYHADQLTQDNSDYSSRQPFHGSTVIKPTYANQQDWTRDPIELARTYTHKHSEPINYSKWTNVNQNSKECLARHAASSIHELACYCILHRPLLPHNKNRIKYFDKLFNQTHSFAQNHTVWVNQKIKLWHLIPASRTPNHLPRQSYWTNQRTKFDQNQTDFPIKIKQFAYPITPRLIDYYFYVIQILYSNVSNYSLFCCCAIENTDWFPFSDKIKTNLITTLWFVCKGHICRSGNPGNLCLFVCQLFGWWSCWLEYISLVRQRTWAPVIASFVCLFWPEGPSVYHKDWNHFGESFIWK